MAPVPKRGKRNESSYVAYVGEKIASLKEIENEEFIKQMNINYQTLFGSYV